MRDPEPPLRVLIADDEAPARRQLRRVLDALAGVELVGEAADGLEALRLAEALRPDLLILDISMPILDGLEVAANLPAAGAPQVIFATAFDAHAIRAFDLAAVDYLLKPWDAERLLRALDRARQRRATGHPPVGLPPGLGGARRVLVRDDDALRPLDCANILAIQARDNQVVLHTAERDWLLREPLGALLARLQAPELLRVHRSHAVNLRHIREVLPLHKGDGDLLLSDGRRVPYSRTCREALLKALAGRPQTGSPSSAGG